MYIKTMRLRLRILLLVTVLLAAASSLACAQSQYPSYGTVIKNAVNIRQQASASSEQVGRLKNGEIVQVLSESMAGNTLWYEISIGNGRTGFVRSDLIKLAQPTPSPAPTATPAPTASPVPAATPEPAPQDTAVQTSQAETGESVQHVASINEKQRIGLYTGATLNGVPHGEGTFVTIDEHVSLTYTGHWENGEIKGAGYIETEEFLLHLRTTQEGRFDKTGPYKGEVFNGLPEGSGRFDTVNSKGIAWYYEGEWKSGLPHGKGIQKWADDNIRVYDGTFENGDFIPDFVQILHWLEDHEDYEFTLDEKSIAFLEKHKIDYFAPNDRRAVRGSDITYSFDLAKFKKKPSGYGSLLLEVSGLKVVQVNTWNYEGREVERMILEDNDGTLYYAFHYGASDIVEDMRVSAHILPLDYETYPNIEGTSIWAIFCAVTNDIRESYIPLYPGEKGDDVLQMKFRLQELGYFSAGAGLSNAYNNTCVERVEQFQLFNDLPITGVADEKTLSVLYSSRAVRKPN